MNRKSRSTMSSLVFLFFVILLQVQDAHTSYMAMGNLQVVVHGETLFSTDIQPNRSATSNLWCQVRDNNVPQPTTWARFVRVKDHKMFMADIDQKDNKALLHFSKSSAEHAGKYRCEIRAPDGTIIFGNLFAFSHPIIKNNASYELTKSSKEASLVEGPRVSGNYKTSVVIPCPVIGYPEPMVNWFKDNFPLEESERVKKLPNGLQIDNLQADDQGVYRCVARNQFPVKIDGPEQEFEIKLDQELQVGGNYGWMLPMAIIVIILLILFIVIFTCQRCSKYKADHYNVAERERSLHNDQVPLKNSV